MNDDILLPDYLSKKETMFVLPLYPVVEMIFKLQKAKEDLDKFVLVVPTESDNQFGIEKFYIVHKDSIKQ